MAGSRLSTEWSPLSFSELDGWAADDQLSALSCFRISARAYADGVHENRRAIAPSPELLEVASKALELDPASLTLDTAKRFFEAHFQPMNRTGNLGFVTAYFEPEVDASRQRSDEFPYPLYGKPSDLVRITEENRPPGLSTDLEYARITENGLVEFYDRGAIDEGALKDRNLEIVWLKSAIEAFYIHIQGSARLVFADGSTSRVSYAGKTGHPYTSIGKVLVSRGVMTVEDANMTNMRAWLEADLDRAMEVLHQNRSYIFFAEVEVDYPEFGPVAAAGVQLTPGRSLAVDRNIHAYGTPIWISTTKPIPSDTKPFRRLMVAQDTGSAIVGPQRGDIFIGSGDEAGMIAGSVRHDTDFVVLEPKV